MKIFQKGFNYSQDGAGNRLVFHLQGCNMHCPWCANPEGMSFEGALVADRDWLLPSICPRGAIREDDVDRRLCRDCTARPCITEHRTKGLRLSYAEIPVGRVIDEACACAMMYYDGGGVTFTGGEATMQFDELQAALMEIHARGIHTAIETNATHPRLPELFPFIDQLIMDCKSCDPETHLRYTGLPLDVVQSNLRAAADRHPRVHVRVPMIGGVNDSADDCDRFLSFFREIMGENVTFEVLAYHEYGKRKWAECGMDYTMTERAYVKPESLRALRDGIKAIGANYQNT